MDRNSLKQKTNRLISGNYFVDGNDLVSKDIDIDLEVNSSCDILFDNIYNIDHINIVVNEDSRLILSILGENEIGNNNIDVVIKRNGELVSYFADFSENEVAFKCQIDLQEENANALFNVASLSACADHKSIDISLVHNAQNTLGKVENYGVCKDRSKLVFSGTSHIVKGSINAKTSQNAKIMVFDQESIAIAKPILKIDENEIMANHAAAVGKINDEHLFYLTSRGISESEAKQLITLGYLKPILSGFKEEEVKQRISSLIERRM